MSNMQTNAHKFAGWTLCVIAVFLLISLGRADLMVVLLPLSLVFGWGISAAGHGGNKDNERRRKGIA
ncbi:MAG: hypothetical protein ACRD2S_04130 [Terriglobales bacterium]